MPCTSSWTAARIEVLTRLWRDGRSASAIARELGRVTRNAVLGKVHRLGLSGRGVPAAPGGDAPRGPKPEMPAARLRRPSAQPPWPRAPESVALDGLADIVSVGPHECRWPIGDPRAPDFKLCGRRAVRGAYCAAHGVVAYRATPPGDHLLKLAGLR